MAVVTWIETEADTLILRGSKQASTAEHDVPPVVLLTGHSLSSIPWEPAPAVCTGVANGAFPHCTPKGHPWMDWIFFCFFLSIPCAVPSRNETPR